MSERDSPWDAPGECGTELLLSFPRAASPGQQEQLHPGLIALSSVCGALCGALTAALLLRFCLRRFILSRRQGQNTVLEPEEEEQERSLNQREHHGPGVSGTNQKQQQKQQAPVNSDITAFATRARVIYPINQKYRPLADGASNPSLHEASCVSPTDPPPSRSPSSSCSDDEDGESKGQIGGGHFVSSALPQSLRFSPVSCSLLTLTLNSVASQMNLYLLAVREVEQKCCELQEEKALIYSQMLKTVFGQRFPKNKQESDFCTDILLTQEKELEEWYQSCTSTSDPGEKVVTVEKVERSQKELLQNQLQKCFSFSEQLERLSEHLLTNPSVFPPEETQGIMSSICKNLLVLEQHLQISQESSLNMILQRVLWWQEVLALLQTQPELLKHEAAFLQSLVSRCVEQMESSRCAEQMESSRCVEQMESSRCVEQMESSRCAEQMKNSRSMEQMENARCAEQMASDGVLKEKVLTEMQRSVNAALEHFHQECMAQTQLLVTENLEQLETKRKKVQKILSRERSQILEKSPRDEQEMVQVLQELRVVQQQQQQQRSDLEDQEHEVLQAVSNQWATLRSSCSAQFSSHCRALFLSAFSESGLSQVQTFRLWSDLEQNLHLQLLEAEEGTREQLQKTRDRLKIQAQMWAEEKVLLEVHLKHLCEEHIKILQNMELRLSYSLHQSSSLHSQDGRLLMLKHLHLQGALQRLFVLRHVSVSLLQEMRLCALSTLRTRGRSLSTPAQKGAEFLEREFPSELETVVEQLQCHLRTILGNALSHSIHQETQQPPLEEQSHTDYMKVALCEAASQSVYLTKDSLIALVHKYYTKLEGAVQTPDPYHFFSDHLGAQQSSAEILHSVLRDLKKWSRKPTSAEFQHRAQQQKQRLLLQIHRETQSRFEELRLQKINREINLDQTRDRIMGAEEDFIQELAALAHVSLTKPQTEPEQEPNICDRSVDLQQLLDLNPALDPALNPSLTPLVAPVKKSEPGLNQVYITSSLLEKYFSKNV